METIIGGFISKFGVFINVFQQQACLAVVINMHL
jgi:hypothetical protein